jgi:hypothetical protein
MNFKEYLEKDNQMRLLENVEISDNLKYHLDKGLNLHENVFRVYSKSYFDLINEVKVLYENNQIAVIDDDAELLETDIGQLAEYNGKLVKLDAPFPLIKKLNEAEHKGKKVKMGKPFRTPGENKKFAVYVKSASGRVKKVRFGDPKLKVKNNNPARAKSFRARHKCSEKNDRTKAGYWACRIGRYAKSVGLSSSKAW